MNEVAQSLPAEVFSQVTPETEKMLWVAVIKETVGQQTLEDIYGGFGGVSERDDAIVLYSGKDYSRDVFAAYKASLGYI